MCLILSFFMVVGAYQVNNSTTYFEILNNGVIERFVVPTEQYLKCLEQDTA